MMIAILLRRISKALYSCAVMVIVACVPAAAQAQATCQPSYTPSPIAGQTFSFGGHTYRLTSCPMSWTDAETEAVSLGGHLVAINGGDEQLWLLSTFGVAANGKMLWIGMQEWLKAGDYVAWTNGEPVGFANWYANQPAKTCDGTDRHVAMSTFLGAWAARAPICGGRQLYYYGIVEIPAASATVMLTVSKTGNGSGTVFTDGINCGASCSRSVATGTSVVLAASPSGGSGLVSWTGCDSAYWNYCVVTPQAARTVTAEFGQGVALTLNDTGIRSCATSDSASSSDSAICNGVMADDRVLPRQDMRFGRDAQAAAGKLSRKGAGNAGFDFTKISNAGAQLPATAILGSGATDWACTLDNNTQMMWEVKANDSTHLRHQGWTYSWYDSVHNYGGNPGTSSGGACKTAGRCDTEKFVADVNAAGLCGFNDWRMPNVKELFNLIDLAIGRPDSEYFPDSSTSMNYWTATPGVLSTYAWYVGGIALSSTGLRSGLSVVRLVRGGQ